MTERPNRVDCPVADGEVHCRRLGHAFAVCVAALGTVATVATVATSLPATAQPVNFEAWPVLSSTFPSTSGGGMMIKGYDPVITGEKCITTFMAVPPGDNPPVYANIVEFDAVAVEGGILCTNGKWRAFEGGASGTTPFRIFFKNGVFRAGG